MGVTICSFLIPIFPFLNVIKGKLNIEDFPIIMVISCYVNYFCWYVYGDMIFSFQIKYGYIIGSFIFGLIIVIYLILEIRKHLFDTILNALMLFSSTWALYRALNFIIDDDRVVGRIWKGTTFIVFVSPIKLLYKVIKENNYKYIPICNCYLSFLYSFCWLVYGIFITDLYVSFTNAIGIILALVQISYYLHLKKKYPIIEERDFSSAFGIETSSNEEIKKETFPFKMNEIPENEENDKI